MTKTKSKSTKTVTCPFCGHETSKVTHTDHESTVRNGLVNWSIKRRRKCCGCQLSFVTKEDVAEAPS